MASSASKISNVPLSIEVRSSLTRRLFNNEMPFLSTHTFCRETSARICVIRPYSFDIERRGQVVDTVHDVCWELDLGPVALIPELHVVVDGGAYTCDIRFLPKAAEGAWRMRYLLRSQMLRHW